MIKRYVWATAIVFIVISLMLPLGLVSAASPLVCLDPGHGGHDPGAVSHGLEEKEINLDVAYRTRSILQSMGYRVILTRDSDVYVSLEERCQIANRAGAAIMVSIHNNASGNPESCGTETFYYYESYEGWLLAKCIQEEAVEKLGRPDRGVKEAGFYPLKYSEMPAALFEGAFLTNDDDAELLADTHFRERMAEGIANGVARYLVDPGNFEEYLLLMNPSGEEIAEVEMTFMLGDGRERHLEVPLSPRQRYTVRVDDHVFARDVSTEVCSQNGVPVIAERSMYFDNQGVSGGHASVGGREPQKKWYLPEGSTAWGYTTYILVQNPSDEINRVRFTFMLPGGPASASEYDLAPHSRFTLRLNDLSNLADMDVSTVVEASYPIVAERAVYFGQGAASGGHDSIGISELSSSWFLAEGYTGGDFDTFILLQNPNGEEAHAVARYMKPGGETVEESYTLLPWSRHTIHVNEVQGMEEAEVSTQVLCDREIAVERSMYFDYGGIQGGHCTRSISALSQQWYLAEGYTAGAFDTYVLLQNPGEESTDVRLDCMDGGGRDKSIGFVLPAHGRWTVKIDDVQGFEAAEVATVVQSEKPIAVERSVYFTRGDISGGHCTTGLSAPETTWYFAEGCTR